MLYSRIGGLARKYLAVEHRRQHRNVCSRRPAWCDGYVQPHDEGLSGRHLIPPREPETQAVEEVWFVTRDTYCCRPR